MNIPFVGREDELDVLETFLHQPNFSALLLTADGGVGKTALLRHFSKQAALDGHWVHFLDLYNLRGATSPSYFLAESLSSGKHLIGKDPLLAH